MCSQVGTTEQLDGDSSCVDPGILADEEAAALENGGQQVYSASSFSLSHPHHNQCTDSHRKASKDSQSRMNQHKTKAQS